MDLGYIGSLLGMLATVVLVLVLAWWATRCVGRQWTGLRQSGGDFAVLRQMSVGRNERLALVQMGGRCFLIGITTGGISLLTELTPEEAEPFQSEGVEPGLASGFLDILQKKGKK